MSGDGTKQPGRWGRHRIRAEQRGQGFVEYALIIALVSLGAVVALGFLSGKINDLFFQAGNGVRGVAQDLTRPDNGTEGSFNIPNQCIIVGGQEIDFTYYQANAVYGPGTQANPKGYEGIYVPTLDMVVLNLARLACPLGGVNDFPPTHFTIGNGYEFDCIWSFVDTWRVASNPSLELGARCAVVPPPPTNGTITLEPTGPSMTGVALTATQSWSNNPETYRFTWQRTGQSSTWAADCSNATNANYGTWQTINTGDNVDSRTPQSSNDGRRCYRVVGHASNPAGQSAAPDPISNAVRVDLPPAPAGGTVTLAPASPAQLGQTLTATTSGWSNNPTDYTFTWQRTNQSTSWASDCSNASSGSYGTFDTNGVDPPDDDDTYSTNNSSNGNRCYRVIVEASNAGGSSNPDATSNPVLLRNPPPPAGGTVTLAPSGPIQLGQTLTATTSGWSNNPTDYTFTWQRTNQSTSWASDCSNASSGSYGTFDTNGIDPPDADDTYTTNSSSNGNRCYRVIVEASNASGDSNPDAVSNAVLMQNPPAPTGGSVTLTPSTPVAWGTPLLATTGGWSNNPTSYTFAWQRTGQSSSWADDCGNASSGQYSTFDTDSTNAPDVDDPYTNNSSSDANRCYRVVVTATNGGGTSPGVTSNAVRVLGPQPPQPGSMSSITPSGADDGDTLNVVANGFTNSPTGYEFEWQQKNRNGSSNCGDSSGYVGYDNNSSSDNDDSTTAQNFSFNGSSNRCYRVRARAENAGGFGDWSDWSTPIWVEDD